MPIRFTRPSRSASGGMLLAGVGLALLGYLLLQRRRRPLRALDALPLSALLGTWYELARLPDRDQAGSRQAGQLEIGSRADARLGLHYRYRDQGREKSAEGQLWRSRRELGGRLRFRPFWPLSAACTVLEIGPGQDYLLVGTPDRRRLWLLSRSPQLPETTWESLLRSAADQGFPVAQLQRVSQPEAAPVFAQPALY